jgi:hypothetical protein
MLCVLEKIFSPDCIPASSGLAREHNVPFVIAVIRSAGHPLSSAVRSRLAYRASLRFVSFYLAFYVSSPLRHVAVDLQFWQMRCPTDSLRNALRHTRHLRVFLSGLRSASGFFVLRSFDIISSCALSKTRPRLKRGAPIFHKAQTQAAWNASMCRQ